MNNFNSKTLTASLLLSISVATVSAQSIELSLNKESGVYALAENIQVTATARDLESDSLHLVVSLNNGTTPLVDTSIPVLKKPTVIFEGSYDAACSLVVEVTAGETSDIIGAIVAPHAILPGIPRPADFDSFWAEQRRETFALPYEVQTNPIELEASDSEYRAYEIEINSPGPRPARGIFAKPANAKRGSLPIVLQLRAAGVKGEWCRAKVDEALAFAKKGQGALCLDLNAHGMLNLEPEAYYEELEEGPLKNYWDHGIESRDEFYFGYMYKRMLRSLEFLTRQPEWDGERIIVIGESQGGGQALAAAGLDPRVRAVVATVPAMGDFGAPLVKRVGGWPQPLDTRIGDEAAIATVPYFDTAHLVEHCRATFVVEIGLADQTCPSTSVYAALNQIDGEVLAIPVSYREHGWPSDADQALHWLENVQGKKNAFIDDYLK